MRIAHRFGGKDDLTGVPHTGPQFFCGECQNKSFSVTYVK